jgi:hypothetical protein
MQKYSKVNDHRAESTSGKILTQRRYEFAENLHPVAHNLPPHIESMKLFVRIRNVVDHVRSLPLAEA